jgi:hypothetical protein
MPSRFIEFDAKVALLDMSKVRPALERHILLEMRHAVRRMLKYMFKYIPVYSGTTAATLLPIARYLNSQADKAAIRLDEGVNPSSRFSSAQHYRWAKNPKTGKYFLAVISGPDPNKGVGVGEGLMDFEFAKSIDRCMFRLQLSNEGIGWINDFFNTRARAQQFFPDKQAADGQWLKHKTPWGIFKAARQIALEYIKTRNRVIQKKVLKDCIKVAHIGKG